MAIDLTTPAATPAEYKGENDRASSDKDTALAATLLAVTRWAEAHAGLAPGQLLPQTALTYTFVGTGGDLLYLRDERGMQYLFRTASAVGIDSEFDGTFDGYTLVLGTDAWLRGYPINAVANGEAFTALQLRAGIANAAPTTWPAGAEVRVTGNCGAAATSMVRQLMKQRVIQVARELVEVHSAGPTLTVADIDATLSMNPSGRQLLHMIEREASFRIPAFG